jgi:hypothetical protein
LIIVRIAREEIFGSVASIMPFDDIDEAIRHWVDNYGDSDPTCRSAVPRRVAGALN